MIRIPCTLTLLVSWLATPWLSTAQSTVPSAIKEQLLEIGFGPSLDPSMTIYQPRLAEAPKDGVTVTKELAYGPHARHRLDVYQPDGAGDTTPVIAFIHGGGYVGGSRDLNDEVYSNIPTYFARHGMLGINATYRLAPESMWPSGAEDMRALVSWIRQHAADYGGDPTQVFLMGHSAGATHVASYAFDPRFQPADGHGLSGIVLISGRYRVYADPDDPSLNTIRSYFGTDPTRYESHSVLTHVPNSDVGSLLVISEYDQRNLVGTTTELFTALCERDDGRCPRLIQLKYHNHLSEVLHVNTEDDQLGREVLEFIHEGAARQAEQSAAR